MLEGSEVRIWKDLKLRTQEMNISTPQEVQTSALGVEKQPDFFLDSSSPYASINERTNPPIDRGFSGTSKGKGKLQNKEHHHPSKSAQIKGHSRHFVQESVKEKEAQVSKNQTNSDGLKAPWYHSQPAHPFRGLGRWASLSIDYSGSILWSIHRVVFFGEAGEVTYSKQKWLEGSFRHATTAHSSVSISFPFWRPKQKKHRRPWQMNRPRSKLWPRRGISVTVSREIHHQRIDPRWLDVVNMISDQFLFSRMWWSMVRYLRDIVLLCTTIL